MSSQRCCCALTTRGCATQGDFGDVVFQVATSERGQTQARLIPPRRLSVRDVAARLKSVAGAEGSVCLMKTNSSSAAVLCVLRLSAFVSGVAVAACPPSQLDFVRCTVPVALQGSVAAKQRYVARMYESTMARGSRGFSALVVESRLRQQAKSQAGKPHDASTKPKPVSPAALEAKFLTRLLCQNLRLGASRLLVLKALAQALVWHQHDAGGGVGSGCSTTRTPPPTRATLKAAEELLVSRFALCPDLRRLADAALHGISSVSQLDASVGMCRVLAVQGGSMA